jgi:CRP-like cAMP-binding protein
VRTFPDTDRALEWCESIVLRSCPVARKQPRGVDFRDHDLCRELDDAELLEFGRTLSEREFPAGAQILRHGDTPDGLYLLLSGHVSVSVDVPPERRRLATLSPGMTIGELALVDRKPRSADVWADTEVTALFLPLAAFDELSQLHPMIKIKVLQTMLHSAARMVDRLNRELASFEP